VDDFHLSHLQIPFSVGTDLLAIAPFGFDVNPDRRDTGVIYSEITFTVPWCKGKVHDVIIPEHFNEFNAALLAVRKRQAHANTIVGLEGMFRVDAAWDRKREVAVIKASIPARHESGDVARWHGPSHYRECMKSCVELEIWMEPEALDEPLAGLEAVIEHIRASRDAYRAKGHIFDEVEKRWR
jgi:hypothetical protein